jgi:glutathione peroxidase
MRKLMMTVTTLCIFSVVPARADITDCAASMDFTKRPLGGGESVHLCEAYRGKVVLIVNTASKCGYTPQYAGLESLYSKNKDRGLVVLGFPSNDFLGQEPGTEQEIKEFCRLTYGVQFPMFEKTPVRESHADPLYRKLAELSGTYPKWNFHKYLLDREGRLIGSFRSGVTPDSKELLDAIETALQGGPAAP